jgi:selenocysteine lyase/cysteine desulfurase
MGLELVSKYRHLFPVLENVTYLNSCSQGALAIPVRDALNEYLDGMYTKGSLWDQWVMKQEELRDLVAEAFVTKRSNVAITTTASAGINSVLSSLDFSGSKKRIVTTDLEFPTMGQILHAQERRGAEVIHVESNIEGLLDLGKFEAALDERVALVAVTHVCYKHGAMTDIKAITDIAHTYNIPVLVDASQSAGSMPIDFDEIGADFMVGGFLKYMLGIPGIGFLLVKDNSSLIPTKTGWFAARNVFAMDIHSYDPAPDARRFQGGTPPVPSIYAAIAGLKILQEVSLEIVHNQVLRLHGIIRDKLNAFNLKVSTPSHSGTHGGLIAFVVQHEHDFVLALEDRGIITSSRSGNVRISPHFYNNDDDIEHLFDGISKQLNDNSQIP